jgi:hypothetical protein
MNGWKDILKRQEKWVYQDPKLQISIYTQFKKEMKKFIGYFIIGASSKEEAVNQKGMLLWSTERPNAITRFLNRVLLKIYWVDKERVLEDRGLKKHPTNPDIEFRTTRFSKFDKPQRPVRTPKFQNNEYKENKHKKRPYPRGGFDTDQE